MSLPSIAWNETTPAGADIISTGDDDIRETKDQIRELFGYNHRLVQGNDINFGYHTQMMLLAQGADPSHVTDTMIMFAKDVSAKAEWHYVKTDDTLVQLTSGGDFIGGFTNEIRIYNGLLANIPTGWTLCDGTGGTPNLVNYFVRSVVDSADTPGSNVVGGTVTLTTANLPIHTHAVTVNSSIPHTHTYQYWNRTIINPNSVAGGNNFWSITYVPGTSGASAAHTHTMTVSESFAGTALTVAPSYYEVAFLIKS